MFLNFFFFLLLEVQQNILSRHFQIWVGRVTANKQFFKSSLDIFSNCHMKISLQSL